MVPDEQRRQKRNEESNDYLEAQEAVQHSQDQQIESSYSQYEER